MGYSARSAASQAHDCLSESDDAGLRRTLRDVPVLPAPANVDDLLARLDAEVEVASGPLAEIISDARFVEPEPVEEESAYDPFFAPLLDVANANIPQPVPPRRPALASWFASGLFAMSLLIGAVLIGWNALTPEASPEVVAPVVQRAEALAVDPAADSDSGSSAPSAIVSGVVTQADGAFVLSAADAARGQAETAQSPEMLAAAPEAVAGPDQSAAMAPEELPASFPISFESATEAQAQSHETLAAPAEPAASPDDRRAEAEPVELALAEPALALPPPAEPVMEVAAAEIQQPVAPVEIADLAPPASMAAEVVRTAPEPVSQTSAEPEPPVQALAGANRDLPVAAPTPPVRPSARTRAPFSGVWAESPEDCTPAGREDGSLLAHIGPRGARAGDAACTFRRTRRTGDSWLIQALCSDGETNWRSDVRLTLKGRSLIWSSQKGSTTYVRCRRG